MIILDLHVDKQSSWKMKKQWPGQIAVTAAPQPKLPTIRGIFSKTLAKPLARHLLMAKQLTSQACYKYYTVIPPGLEGQSFWL